MKRILFNVVTVVALSFMAIPSSAQDIIVTNDAKKIDAKILEVSKTEIRYKESDNLEGPTFILGVEDINCIIYANDKVVLYNKQPQTDRANQLGSLFGNTDTSTTTRANPLGSGTTGGNSWSLKGRTLKSLPRPSSDFKQEGTVIVKIEVNSHGEVVSAEVDGGTISDSYTRKLAIDAAYKAKFDASETIKQEGSITYKFSFR